MLPVMFAQERQITGGLPPQPTGDRYSAFADGSDTNFLSVPEANFDLEVSKWHGFFWVMFDTFPVTNGTIQPVIGQYNQVPDDSAFAAGAAMSLSGQELFALTTCRDVPPHVFDNTLATNHYNNFGPIQTGVWYFVDYWFDTVLSQVSIRVNGNSTQGQNITFIADLPSCSSVVDLRTFLFTGGPFADTYTLHGRMGGTGFRRGSKWSDAEMAYLYNGGCQILKSEVNLTAFPTFFTDLYTWWDMQEGAGATRDNAEGTAARDLLNNGTVGQSCGTCFSCPSTLLDSLFGAYHADEPNASMLLDASGLAHDFTDVNGVGSTPGVFATGRIFAAASSEEFTRDDEAAQAFTTKLSMGGWLRPTSNAGPQSYFQKWLNGITNSMFRVFHPGAGLGTKFEFSNTINGDNTADALAGQWVHGAWVYDGTAVGNAARLKHYRNGVLQTLAFTGTVPATLSASTQPLRIGGVGPNDYDGSMDEVAMWGGKSLTQAEVVEHMNNVHPWTSASPLLATMYSSFHFDEQSGGAIDASGAAHHLTDNNGVTAGAGAPTTGANSARLFVAASSQYLSRPTEPSQQFTTGLSVAMWVNPASLLPDMPLCAKYSIPGQQMFLIDEISGSLFCFLSSGSIFGSKVGVLAIGTWVHICWTYDGTLTANVTGVYSDADRLKLFINGVGQQVLAIGGTIPASLPSSTAALTFGTFDTGTVFYDGLIDEATIWPRAIAQAEVAMHKSGVYPWKKS